MQRITLVLLLLWICAWVIRISSGCVTHMFKFLCYFFLGVLCVDCIRPQSFEFSAHNTDKENTKRWTCFTFQLLCLIIHTPYRFKISTGSQIAISPVGSVHIRILIFSLITVTHMHIFYVYVCFTNNNNNNIFYILYIFSQLYKTHLD